jgi:hypothetical protein
MLSVVPAGPRLIAQTSGTRQAVSASNSQATITSYCVSCHNEKRRAAGQSPFAFDTLDVARVGVHADVWEKVLTRIRTGSMPPAGNPRPDAAAYDGLATWLEGELDRAAAANPNPGRLPQFHRLNRAEYQNAVRDLLGLDHLPKELDIASLLPVDDASYGFDNIADALNTTPMLIERYLAAAQKMSALAVGDPSLPMIVDTYRIAPQLPQDDRFDGLPFGTRGGVNIRRTFPLDGDYVIRLALTAARGADPHQLEVSIDGERVQVFTVGGPQGGGRGRGAGGRGAPAPPGAPPAGPPPPPAPAATPDDPNGYQMNASAGPLQVRRAIKAGPHLVTVTFVKKTSALGEQNLRPFTRAGQGDAPPEPALASVVISGPFDARGPGDTPSRQRIFVCRPASPADEDACAGKILSTLARRAYRRPPSSADLQVLTAFYRDGKAASGFEAGIQRAIERVLVSPAFLFRMERAPGRGVSRISDFELASRLSFFLWSSIPDDELLDLAERGRLKDAGTLERQVRRMLADSRSAALIENFAGQWLTLRDLDDKTPDPRLFPDFDENLRRAMRRETELFVESVVRENRTVLDFLTADYTFINQRLAKHYGMPNVYGDQFRRVTLGAGERRGLLGHASILTITSYAHRTSPVLRGKWMMETVLGTPPAPPPADVPTLVERNEKTLVPLTMREAMAQHRSNAMCASCHSRMDPLGFAFERFDAVGRLRTEAGGSPIDASGILPDGTKFDGAAGLIAVLARQPRQFAGAVTERLLTYALGRGVEYYDAPAVRAVVREAAADNYRFGSLIAGIVKSVPFQMRGASAPQAGTVAQK